MKNIVCFAGRTSAGKSAIADMAAKELGLKIVQSYTTRPPRKEEVEAGLESSDHIFVSDEEFDKLTGVVALTKINGVRYCTTEEVLDHSDIYVIDPDGIKYLQDTAGARYRLTVFYVYADKEIRKSRYVKRGGNAEDFEKRDKSENDQFLRFEEGDGMDVIIFNNGDINDAFNEVMQYMNAIYGRNVIAA